MLYREESTVERIRVIDQTPLSLFARRVLFAWKFDVESGGDTHTILVCISF